MRGLLRDRTAQLPVSREKKRARFAGLTPIEQIAWDYRTMRHSPRAHPLALVRERLRRQGLPSASELMNLRHGERVRFAGLVICRQRPGTASGVTFMTLEDETGFANLVLWKRVFDEHLVLARTSSFLGVTGTLQKQDDVVHLVAESLWTPDTNMLEVSSRDFH